MQRSPNTRETARRRIAIVASHRVQYHAPWFRELDQLCDLTVLFAHDQSPADQARAGYGVPFGWDSDVVSGYTAEFLTNVSAEPTSQRFSGCDTPGVGERLSKGNFDAVIVSGWNLKTYWQTVYWCRRHHVPVLVRGDSQLRSPRGAAKRIAKEIGYPVLLRQFDGFLSVGTRNREYLRHYHVPIQRIAFVPHHVDRRLFVPTLTVCERRELREQLGVPIDRTVALFVGRLIDFKRPLDLVEALAELERAGERFAGMFVGAGVLEAEIRTRAESLGVTLALLGFRNQSELPRLYAAADVLVLPSAGDETWGMVVNEAMSCGIPAVVSSEVGCGPNLISPGKTGHTFACGDTKDLARALRATKKMLGTSELATALSARMDEFSSEVAARNTLVAVEEAIARKRDGLNGYVCVSRRRALRG